MKKAVFLDRDGTLIVDKVYLNDPDQIEYLPGVFEGMRIMRDLGYIFLVATNQSGIPKGIVKLENLHEIHRRIQNEFKRHEIQIAGFYFAPHATDSGHPDRKPSPGMLLAGARDHDVDLKKSWMIGDRLTDIQAGENAGTRTALIGMIETPTENIKPTIHSPHWIDLIEKFKRYQIQNI